MRYLLLVYRDQTLLEALAPGERDVWTRACAANDDALRASGQLVAVEALHGSETALTVRLEHGRLTLDNGPCVSRGDWLAGLCIVDARDLNEAVQVAAYMPQLRGGPIEVRPLVDASHPGSHAGESLGVRANSATGDHFV